MKYKCTRTMKNESQIWVIQYKVLRMAFHTAAFVLKISNL